VGNPNVLRHGDVVIAVNEIFDTIQGEGVFAGVPSVFIRLQGCPVGCPWCDTKHTWPTSERKRVSIDDMMAKAEDAPTWAAMEVIDVVENVRQFGHSHFVITGGEPAAQDIYELTVALGEFGRVQLETSGTYPLRVSVDTWVTVSPKIDMPGGLDVLADAIHRANEIKMPVETQADIDKLGRLLEGYDGVAQVELQPVSTDADATALCVNECMARDWRLSLQTHKFLDVR
jgi:7-carboxy-7-deazaguanine synthase